MSIDTMKAVMQYSRSKGVDRLVLLMIADCANDEGTHAFPSIATIAKKANCSERSVPRSIASLVEIGELRIEPRPGSSNVYTVILTPTQIVTPDNLTPPRKLSPTPPHPVTPPPPNLSPITQREPSITPRGTPPTPSREYPSGETTAPQGTPDPSRDLFGIPLGYSATIEFRPKRGPVEQLLTYEELLPPEIATPEVLEAFRQWVLKRRRKFGPHDAVEELSAKHCIKTMLMPLVREGKFTAVEIVEAAAANGWKGFFEPKNVKSDKPTGPRTAADRAGHQVTPERFSEISEHHKRREIQRNRPDDRGGTGSGPPEAPNYRW